MPHRDSAVFAFRHAGEADVPAIVRLVQSSYRGDESREGWTTEAGLLQGQRTDIRGVAAAMSSPGCIILLAEARSELVACCQLESRENRTAHFGLFAVRPRAQGQGIGAAVVGEAEELARREWGAVTMRMMVIRQRGELIAWYERRGYVRTGETAPFPYGDERFGLPLRADLEFVELSKTL